MECQFQSIVKSTVYLIIVSYVRCTLAPKYSGQRGHTMGRWIGDDGNTMIDNINASVDNIAM